MHWQSGTAQLPPRHIARRTRGPLFLTDRKAPAGTPQASDLKPAHGWHEESLAGFEDKESS